MFRKSPPVAAILLSACTVLVPETMAQLITASPLTADPEGLGIQLDLPNGIGIMPDSARMTLSNQHDGTVTQGTFVLNRQGDTFRIAPDDVERLRSLQAILQAQKAEHPNGNSGSLRITAGPCIAGHPLDAGATVSAAIQLDADDGFLPLFRDQPLTTLFGTADPVSFPACPAQEPKTKVSYQDR